MREIERSGKKLDPSYDDWMAHTTSRLLQARSWNLKGKSPFKRITLKLQVSKKKSLQNTKSQLTSHVQ